IDGLLAQIEKPRRQASEPLTPQRTQHWIRGDVTLCLLEVCKDGMCWDGYAANRHLWINRPNCRMLTKDYLVRCTSDHRRCRHGILRNYRPDMFVLRSQVL